MGAMAFCGLTPVQMAESGKHTETKNQYRNKESIQKQRINTETKNQHRNKESIQKQRINTETKNQLLHLGADYSCVVQ
jgi:hypothetical protein